MLVFVSVLARIHIIPTVVLSIFGANSVYTDQGKVTIRSPNQTVEGRIYFRKESPYILIGPYPFPAQDDFFFIRKDCVVRRILDEKIEGDFFRLYKWLFISFDLSSRLDAMAPHVSLDTEIRYDPLQSKYHYKILGTGLVYPNPEKYQITFTVDQKILSLLQAKEVY